MNKFFKLWVCVILIGFSSFNLAHAKNATGVNKYAWIASLQIIKFMPMVSADPNSGLIITDWYNVNNNARYKLDVYVLNGLLTPDTVKVSVFKQVKSGSSWDNVKVSADVATKLEGAILNQARLLRAQQN